MKKSKSHSPFRYVLKEICRPREDPAKSVFVCDGPGIWLE